MDVDRPDEGAALAAAVLGFLAGDGRRPDP